MKIEQIAFGCNNKEAFDEALKNCEVSDIVTFTGYFKRTAGATHFKDVTGHLAFDYRMGIEREYLWYPYHYDTFHTMIPNKQKYFLSHLGCHVDSIDFVLADNPQWNVVMDVMTTHHENAKLQELGRKYRYVIIDQRETNGYFFKLIQRIEKPAANPA